MSNDVIPLDDGFGGSLRGGRIIKGHFGKWTDAHGWHDRDGLALPSPVLVIGLIECLQTWKDKKPEYITEKPLSDPDALNAAIPLSEWECDLNGQPRPPWSHTVGAYLINPATGAIYTYLSDTTRAHMAIEALREQTIVMRALRGPQVIPLVALESRPWKTAYGMRKKPHFEPLDWKLPNGGGGVLVSPKPPLIEGPTTAASTEPTPAPAEPTPTPPVSSPPATTPPQAKPAATVAAETITSMESAKPVTMREFLDDEVPW